MIEIKYECNTCKRWFMEGQIEQKLITAFAVYYICGDCSGPHYFHSDGRLLKARQGFGSRRRY